MNDNPFDKFSALARQHFDDDFVSTAKKLLAALRVPEHAAGVLLPIVANAVLLVVLMNRRPVAARAVASGLRSSFPLN